MPTEKAVIQKAGFLKYKARFILLSLILLMLFVRMSVLINSPEIFYNIEALYRGSIGLEIIKGLRCNLLHYQYATYEGGSLMIGLLVAPLFLLFRDTFFSLSLVPLLFAISSLIILFLFLCRYFGQFVATLAGLFFIFLPQRFMEYSFIPLGNHPESIFFSLLVFIIFYQIFFRSSIMYENPKLNKKVFILIICFGFISGLATFCCYTFLVTLFTLLLFWYIFDKRFILKRHFLFFALAFLIGFSPWIANLQRLSFVEVTNLYGKSFFDYPSPKNLISSFISFGKFLIVNLRESFFKIGKPDGMESPFFFTEFPYFAFLLSFICILTINTKSILKVFLGAIPFIDRFKLKPNDITKETPILVYVIIYLFVYHLFSLAVPESNYAYDTRYLMAIYPFILILQAIFLNKLFGKRKINDGKFIVSMRIAGSSFLIFFIGAGILNYSSYIIPLNNENFDKVFRYKGYSMKLSYPLLYQEYAPFLKDAHYSREFIAGSATPRSFKNPFGYGLWGKTGADYKFRLREQIRLINSLEKRFRPNVYIWVGIDIGDRFGDDLAACRDLVDGYIEDRYRHYVYEGIALSVQNRLFREMVKKKSLEKIPSEYRHYFYNSLGFFIGRYYREKTSDVIPMLKSLQQKDRDYFIQGIVDGIEEDSLVDFLNNRNDILVSLHDKTYLYSRLGGVYSQERSLREIENIDKRYRPYFLQGMGEKVFNRIFNKHYTDGNISSMLEPGIINNVLKKVEEKVNNIPSLRDASILYRGIGNRVSFITFGNLKDWNFSNGSIPRDYLRYFYEGYGEALRVRYGRDLERIGEIIRDNVEKENSLYAYIGVERVENKLDGYSAMREFSRKETKVIHDSKIVRFITMDGCQIVGTWTVPKNLGNNKLPTLILIHDVATTRKTWGYEPFSKIFLERGYATLAIDLRGRGESLLADGSKIDDFISFSDLETEVKIRNEIERMYLDVQAAIDWLKVQPEVDVSRIGIIGVSLGANVAYVSIGTCNDIKTAISISPSYEWLTGKNMKDFSPHSLLFIASKYDEGGASAVAIKRLNAQALLPKRVKIHYSDLHGYELLILLEHEVLNWLRHTI